MRIMYLKRTWAVHFVLFVATHFKELISSSSFLLNHNFLWLEDFRTLLKFPWISQGYSVSNVSLCHGSIPTGSAEGVVVHD